MAVALLFTPKSLTAEQYQQIIQQLEASGAGAPPGRRFHACFGSGDRLKVFELWDTVEEFDAFGATLMPMLTDAQIEMGPPEPLEIHGLIEADDASALRKRIDALLELAFFRRPVEKLRDRLHQGSESGTVEKLREKIHKPKQTSVDQQKQVEESTTP